MKLTQKDLDNFNNIIRQAVYHGGDDGGAYFCEPDDLYDAVKTFVESSEDELELYWAKYVLEHKPEYKWFLCESTPERLASGNDKDFLQVRFKEKKDD